MVDSRHYQATLQALGAELMERKLRLDRHGRDGVPADSEEQASARANDEVVESLGQQMRNELADIGATLHRNELGTFGVCTRCGVAIVAARLELIPNTATCSACA